MKRILQIEIDYEMNDEAEKNIDCILESVPTRLSREGCFSGCTNAVVNEWKYRLTDEQGRLIGHGSDLWHSKLPEVTEQNA